MANLKKWIENETKDEKIVGVVIGEMGWGDFGSESVPSYDKQPKGVVLSWEDAAPLLDYEFDSGFGAPECNAVYVWTNKSVLFVVQYDGSTGMHSIPRRPKNCMPEMPGG